MIAAGVAGPKTAGDGAEVGLRTTRDGSVVNAHGHGRFQEAVYRGNVFMLDSGSVTTETAHKTEGLAGTIKLINGIFNPPTSAKNAVILYAVVMPVSAVAKGGFIWNAQACPALTSAATGTIRNALLSGGVGSAMTAESNVKLVRQDAATTAFTQLSTMGGPDAFEVVSANLTAIEETAGRLIVPPGWVCGLTTIGVPTMVVQSTIFWEEIPA